MRAASPLVVLLVILSWTLPAHAGAQTLITEADGVLDKAAAQPSSDPVDEVHDEIEGVGDTNSGVVEEVLTPPPDVVVTSPPAVVVTSSPAAAPAPPRDIVVASPQQHSAGKRSGPTSKAHKRSPTRRHKDRTGTPTLQAEDTRQPDRNDLRQVASAGNEIHPTEVKGLTLTAVRRSLLAVTGVFLLTWMTAALFLIGLGALSLLSSRPRFASFSMRA
jgi:hypothetical protein